ncbi:hypothetical protein NE237_010775 [Protea cynaroides]|uniref:Uncharacterized protein n=1 Tax=Protea cynaroides TaxID=273540 RepID=A0A9Q0R205_9MAGN|nr:hypothetical protein NE237_010775 [Protea cynaroides]
MKDLHISSLLLKKLVIEISVEDHKSFDHIQDFNGPTVCKIKICAPNLTSFRCRNNMARDYVLENICSPYNADIDVFLENHLDSELTTLPSESREEHAKYVVDWLRRLYDVKALSLSSMFIWQRSWHGTLFKYAYGTCGYQMSCKLAKQVRP